MEIAVAMVVVVVAYLLLGLVVLVRCRDQVVQELKADGFCGVGSALAGVIYFAFFWLLWPVLFRPPKQ